MADPRLEYRARCYISLDRLPRYVEERTAEEWAYDLQNNIPISRALAQRIDDWGIPFPTIIPHPYPPTLPTPRGPARYISTIQRTEFNAGAPHFMRRVRTLHQPLQTQPLRSESTRSLHHHLPPLPIQLTVLYQAPLHPPIHAQAPSIIKHFHPAAPPPNSTPTPSTTSDTPPSTTTTARPQHPITFTEFYRQMALNGLV